MDVTESVIIDFSKEPNDIDSDAMMVEETQNSSSFTRSKEVIVIFFVLHVFSYYNFKIFTP
jgi:hypothetical protein